MFKFRRSSSLCSPSSSKELFQDDDQDQEDKTQNQKSSPETSGDGSGTGRARSRENVTKKSNSGSEKSTPTGEMTKWSFNGEKFKANFKKSFIGQVICDRKRKERQESVNQDDACGSQEKKVVRSVSEDESSESGSGSNTPQDKQVNKQDFKRTQSHGDFVAGSSIEVNKDLGKNLEPILDHPQTNMTRKYEGDYEPELQRQLERFVNYGGMSAPTKPAKSGGGHGHRRRYKSSHNSDRTSGSLLLGRQDGDIEDSKKREERRSSSSGAGHGHGDKANGNPIGQEKDKPQEEEEEEEICESPDNLKESSSGTSSSSSPSEVEDSSKSIPIVMVEDSSGGIEENENKNGFELDFSTMHHQIETSKPISFLESIGQGSNDQVMLSPRSGFLGKEAIDVPPSPPMYQIQVDPPLSRQSFLGDNNEISSKINSLTRLISNLRRNMKLMEEEYEQMFGYKPSKSDKMKHRDMKKCILNLSKARREIKELKEDPAAVQEVNILSLSGQGEPLGVNPFSSLRGTPEYLASLQTTVKEIDECLGHKRRALGRADNPEQMSNSELLDEKCAMQKQLLILEKRHGRPCSKQEKNIVRPLYDKYRMVKKLSVRIGSSSFSKDRDSALDLVPILENETLELDADAGGVGGGSSGATLDPPIVSPKAKRSSLSVNRRIVSLDTTEMELGRGRGDDEEEEDDGLEENESFNEMNLEELEIRLRQAREEKRRYRSSLRRFEIDFQEALGRPPLKEEKKSSTEMEFTYQKYKRSRATIRLIEVLMNKKKYPHSHLSQEQFQSED